MALPLWRQQTARRLVENAKAIKDRDFAEKQIAEANALLAQAAETMESVYQTVRTKIGS
jgi:formiminotetrahydrofolate cyclodeaminase